MTIMEAIAARHSVRSYEQKDIPGDILCQLEAELAAINRESGLHLQLVMKEPQVFSGMMAHYGKFSGVENFIALVGKKSPELEEKLGYYGERFVLKAQTLGLNTCWVALTFSKGAAKKCISVGSAEKLVAVIALGYGTTQGIKHKSKAITALCAAKGEMPPWFQRGMDAAMLAPTAVNQQKFFFTLEGEKVTAKSLGGFYSKMDLGIAKYHFETASGRQVE